MSSALVLFALLAPRLANAGELRAPVLALLDGVEDVPEAEDLRALGDGVGAELLELAADGTLQPTRRARATQALGWFPSDASREFLTQTLKGGDSLQARKAAYALVNGWGDEALPLVQTALVSDDVQLRLATCRAISTLGTDASRATLRARLELETNAAVKDLIRQSLTR